jgi:hypothetical protein
MLTCVCLIPIGSIKIYVLCSAWQVLFEILVLDCQCGVNIYIYIYMILLFNFDLIINVGLLVGIENYVVEPFIGINL